ncbi:succinylglutamate desuccinylase, partial [Vibrio antiquarius]
MTKSLFRQSFLTDTLDVHIDVAPAEQVLSNGVKLKLYQRGVLEVIPANYTQDTKNIIISCGVHGDETAPMELVDSIIQDIESGFQTVDTRCLFI